MNNFNNKLAVITGASRGIGFEVAKHLASLNTRLLIISRNETELSKACKSLNRINNKDNIQLKIDVSNRLDILNVKNYLEKNHLEIDAIINCAGIYGPIGSILEVNLEEFEKAFKINFFGTINMINILKFNFVKNKKKKIINFSGGGAATPFPFYSAYATSKAAIVRLTENIALELKEEGYLVNCIAPGFIATSLHEDTIRAGPDKVGKDFYIKTKEVLNNGGASVKYTCELVEFLISDKSDSFNGRFISANWDMWQEDDFKNKIKNDDDFATLRRIDDKKFFKQK